MVNYLSHTGPGLTSQWQITHTLCILLLSFTGNCSPLFQKKEKGCRNVFILSMKTFHGRNVPDEGVDLGNS